MIFDISQLGGVRFNISGNEIRNHCKTRAEYHSNRARFYDEQAKVFAKEVGEIEREEDATKYANTVTHSNRQRMEQSKLHHTDRVKFFHFASEHLTESEYKMTEAELKNFEMIP